VFPKTAWNILKIIGGVGTLDFIVTFRNVSAISDPV